MELRIEYLNPADLTPYENNTRKHAPNDIEQIKESIKQDGFNDPIGIWGEDNIIVEGHGRQIAALEMGLDKVPVIRLDHMTDDQRRDYAIRHNRTAELSSWDFTALQEEIAQLEIEGHDLSGLNFSFDFESIDGGIGGSGESDGFYTTKVNIPQYEPTGECPDLDDCIDLTRYNEICEKIESTKLNPEVKKFLIHAAGRHIGFNYKVIANFYAHQPKEIQELMEDSALVIIDVNDAIAKGYAELSERLDEIEELDNEEE